MELNQNEIYLIFKDKTYGLTINSTNLTHIIRYAMETVEIYNLNGNQKKEMAISLIKQLINDVNQKEKDIILQLIENGSVPETIDIIIAASKGELKLNHIIRTGLNCCLTFLQRFKK